MRICRWKPFWFSSGDTFSKAYLAEWERVKDEQSHIPGEDKPHSISRTTELGKLQKAWRDENNTTREQYCDASSSLKSSWQAVGESDAPSWKYTGTEGTAVFWEPLGAPLLPKNVFATTCTQSNLAVFPKRLVLPYPDEEILSGYEDVLVRTGWFFGMGEDGPRDHS